MPKRVAIYCRVSTIMQEEKDSLEYQIKRLEEHIASNPEFIKYEVFTDVESGAKDKRPDFIRLQNLMKDPINKPDVILVTELSRISRRTVKLLEFMELCLEHNIDFISITQNIDTSTPGGRMMYSVLGSMSSYEREIISERVRAQKLIKVKAGNFQGSKIPYGYKSAARGILVPDEVTSENVKDIFNMFIAGSTLKDIGRKHNLLDTVVKHVLQNPIYYGKLRYNRRRKNIKTGKAEMTRNEFLSKGNHKAIITEETFNTVQAIIKNKYVKKIRTVDNDAFLLGGLIQCHCGRKMYGVANSSKTSTYYVCSTVGCKKRGVRSVEFEEEILSQLRKLKDSPELFTIDEIDESDTFIARLKTLEKHNETLSTQKNKLLKVFLSEIITEAEFEEESFNISSSINKNNKEISDIKSRLNYRVAEVSNRQFFFDTLTKINTLERKELKQLLRILIDRIEFEDDERYKIIYRV